MWEIWSSFIEYFIIGELVLEVLEGKVQEVGRSAFGEGQLIGNDVEVLGPGVGHLGGQCGQITVKGVELRGAEVGRFNAHSNFIIKY